MWPNCVGLGSFFETASRLYAQVRYRACVVVVVVDVGLGDGEVVFDHVEAGVAEDLLEGVEVAAVAEVVDGEGVAEAVEGGSFYAGAFADVGDAFVEHAAFDGAVVGGDDEGLVEAGVGAVEGDVFPEDLGGAWGDGDVAVFAAFAE